MRLHAVLGAPYGSHGAGAHSQRYLTQVFWLFPILRCLKKSLLAWLHPKPRHPAHVHPSGLWTRPVVRARSSWNVQAAGGLRAPFHLNPWHLQTWPGAGRTARLSWVPAEEGTSPSPSWRTAKPQGWRQAPPT